MSYETLNAERREWIEATLTDLQLQVFRARFNTFSFQQIATAMNLDEATVRGHHKRAVRRLANARRDVLPKSPEGVCEHETTTQKEPR